MILSCLSCPFSLIKSLFCHLFNFKFKPIKHAIMILIEDKKDKKRAMEIFVSAFIDAPGIMWVLKRKSNAARIITINILFHEGLVKKGAYITNDKNGALLFYSTDDGRLSFINTLRKLYLILFYSSIVNAYRLIKYRKIISATRPKGALVGFLVATDQNVVGNEAAYEIKREMFEMSKNLGKDICLETSIPRVRKLYQISGYKEYASIKHPYEDLTIWFFRKEFSNEL